MSKLHHEVVTFLNAISSRKAARDSKLADTNNPNIIEKSRNATEEFFKSQIDYIPEVREVYDQILDHITLRVYNDTGFDGGNCLIYFHGGGWCLGSLDTADVFCRQLAINSKSVVISVEYRLSPEYKFPAALEDAVKVYKSVIEWKNYQIVGIAGDSAGGNLAASLILKLESIKYKVMPDYQLLFYPVLDLTCSTKSYEEYTEGYFLTKKNMLRYIRDYMIEGDNVKDPLYSPINSENLSIFPPTHLVGAECDVLHDEIVEFYKKLRQAGVEVTYQEYQGMIHGFLQLPKSIPSVHQIYKEIGSQIENLIEKAYLEKVKKSQAIEDVIIALSDLQLGEVEDVQITVDNNYQKQRSCCMIL